MRGQSWFASLVLIASTGLAGCAARPADVAQIDELAGAERAFAASAHASVRLAFLAVLADDATLFRPGPVDGKPFIAARPDGPFELAWQPQRVAVAASGELGYSSGPYRLTANADPAHPSYGQFFTIWRRGPDGRWQVLFDHGNAHDGPVGWTAPFEAIVGDGSAASRSIAHAEAAFAARAAASGTADAYRVHGSAHLRLLRDDAAPLDGVDAATRLPGATARWIWTVARSGVSRSGDFAWTTGDYRSTVVGVASHGAFVRAWVVEGGDWKILGDVLAPIDEPVR